VSVAEALALPGTFRTFREGAWSFSVAFASCAVTGSRNAIFDTVRTLRPDLFVHTGDFHYEDIGRDDPAAYRHAYDAVLGSPVQGRLFRSVPVAYTWDDHDFGGNNANGSSRSRPAVQAVYRQFVPHYALDDDGGGIQHAFTMGRVPVIVTDSRSYRSSSRGEARLRTILGPRQRTWLKDKLGAAAGAPLVIWVNSVPWIARATSGADNWGAYAAEREEIANHVASLGLTRRLLVLSGDAHMVAIDDGTHSNYATGTGRGQRGFVVMHAAPLDRRTSEKGGPYSHGISRERGQFGLVDVTDDGQKLSIELSGRDRAGARIPGMVLALSCDGQACRIVR
jgi:phosphodiesterase/alkaline phosphatase D-like protein